MPKVTLIDHFASADSEAPGFACGVNDLWLGTGANVTYVDRAAIGAGRPCAFQMNSTVVGRDAAAVALSAASSAAAMCAAKASAICAAPAAAAICSALRVADGAQEIDQRTFQIHEAPHTSSDLLYKNSLDDQARTHLLGAHPRRSRRAPHRRLSEGAQPSALATRPRRTARPAWRSRPTTCAAPTAPPAARSKRKSFSTCNLARHPAKAGAASHRLRFLQEVIDRLPYAPAREHLQHLLEQRFAR